MNQKALHTLEYDKIIRLLIDKATSDPGRKMCENLQPGNSISQIDLRQEQTAAPPVQKRQYFFWKQS